MSEAAAPPTDAPKISVIIPVHNDAPHLVVCLEAVQRSEYRNYEIIVVDDGSTEPLPASARQTGIRIVRLERRSGPAAARNRGAEAARGAYLLFSDADVRVAADTLARFAAVFEEDPEVAAVFGSYDTHPPAPSIVSQYKNLLHHYVHQQGSRAASTFWSGCGAVRRAVFLDLGGFDEDYGRPCIEDIDLGARMRKSGYRIVLGKEIQVTHLKRWTFRGMLKSDIFDRAIPWTRLILREKSLPRDLNLKMSQRLSAVLSLTLLLVLLVGVWYVPAVGLLLVAPIVGIPLLDHCSLAKPGPAACVGLAALAWLGGAAALGFHFGLWTLLPLGLVAGVILLNLRLLLFFVRTRGPLFAAVVLPLLMFYFVYSSVVFAGCVFSHRLRSVRPWRRSTGGDGS